MVVRVRNDGMGVYHAAAQHDDGGEYGGERGQFLEHGVYLYIRCGWGRAKRPPAVRGHRYRLPLNPITTDARARLTPKARSGKGFRKSRRGAAPTGRRNGRGSAAHIAAMRIGTRFAPQVPGLASNTPAQAVPQALHLPWASRFHSVSTYQSRPTSLAPQL